MISNCIFPLYTRMYKNARRNIMIEKKELKKKIEEEEEEIDLKTLKKNQKRKFLEINSQIIFNADMKRKTRKRKQNDLNDVNDTSNKFVEPFAELKWVHKKLNKNNTKKD